MLLLFQCDWTLERQGEARGNRTWEMCSLVCDDMASGKQWNGKNQSRIGFWGSAVFPRCRGSCVGDTFPVLFLLKQAHPRGKGVDICLPLFNVPTLRSNELADCAQLLKSVFTKMC